jgi:Ca2+-binding RTX toxin-like protein
MAIIIGDDGNDQPVEFGITWLYDGLFGTDEDDQIYGLGGDDLLIGDGGNDLLDGGTGADEMHGGSGSDTYIVDNPGDRVLFEENANGFGDTVKSSISYTLPVNVENLVLFDVPYAYEGTGNQHDNEIIGNKLNNVLKGFGGVDVLEGRGGADFLYGGDLSDELYGGDHDDELFGESGYDTLVGGDGHDKLDGGTGGDGMQGGAGDDDYFVDNPLDVVTELGSAGHDTVFASISETLSANVEDLILQDGAGMISGTGNGHNNIITGNNANNTLRGLAGGDTLEGGAGDDVLDGGIGRVDGYFGGDTLIGGGGRDTFRFNSRLDSVGLSVDEIQDFQRGVTAKGGNYVPGDKIDLSAIDAVQSSALSSLNDTFTFIGTQSFTAAGQVRVEADGDSLLVEADVSGDGNADFMLTVHTANNVLLSAADFIL